MKLKTYKELLFYSLTPITIISLDDTNIKIEYNDLDKFKNSEECNDYEVVAFITAKYYVDIFIKK